jgi:hypothetical protein
MFVDIQVEHALLLPLMPMLERDEVRILVDHSGRPTVAEGVAQPGLSRSCWTSPRRAAPT